MSNGNDTPNFPPPPSGPPDNSGSGSGPGSSPADDAAGSATPDNANQSSANPNGVNPADSSPPRPSGAPADPNRSQPPQNPNIPPSNEPPAFGNRGQQGYPGAAGYGSGQSAPGQNYPDSYGNGQSGSSQYGNSQGDPNQPGPYPGGPYQTGSGPNTSGTRSGTGPSQATPQPAPAPGFAGSQAAATRADARPEKKKSRLPLFITLGAVGLVIILVLVGFLVVHNVNKNNYGPANVAEDYVSALSKGDFAAAEKIAPSPRPEGTNLDLLSKNFTDASSSKVENAKVESSDVDGDKGKVTVSYELDGNAYDVELPAQKDGRQDLFFDKWKLTGPALNVVSLDIPAADGLQVNGVDYKAKSGTTSFAVYPGTYDFKVAGSKWVSDASDTAAVNFPQAFAPGEKPSTDEVAPTTLNLDVSPTSAFEKEVQKQVEKKLKKCFDNKSIEPKCDFIKFDPTEIPVGGSDKKLDDLAKKDTAKWDMKDMPKVKATFGTADTNTGSFFTEKPGKFNFTVQGKKAGSSYFSNSNPLSVSGTVKIDGDKLSVEFFDF